MGREDLQSVLEKASGFDVICFFGFDKAAMYQEESLKEKTLIFFNSSKSLFSIEVDEIAYTETQCDLESFQALCREKIFLSFFYAIHPDMKESDYARAKAWSERCQMVQWQCHLAASEWQDFGLQALKNSVKDRVESVDTDSFAQLKNSLKGIPAFICGAGPSLNEAIDTFKLKSTFNQGVLFAGGAALGLLTKEGVSLHIATGIDPNPSYERALMQGSFEAPFFCQSRFSSSLLKTVQGPVFQVPGNSGYKLEQWMAGGTTFDGGWTVSTFSIALALHFGCNPIVLVGMDLSYPIDSSSYAGGISKQERGLEWNDPMSGPLLTQKDWVLAAGWIEDVVKNSPATSFYSTSSKGLFLDGVERVSLEKLLEGVLYKSYDIAGFMQVLSSFWKQSGGVEEKVDVLNKSIEHAFILINKLLQLFEMNYPEDPTSKGEFVINLFDLYDEMAYQEMLEPLWQVWQIPLERKSTGAYAKEVNRLLFFKKVLQEYRDCICQ